jgi:DNA-binding beta-propeller fold protein YncE
MLTWSKPEWLWRMLCAMLLCVGAVVGCSASGAEFKRPNGVAVAPDGSLRVMDLGHYRVAHVSPAGMLLDTFGELGTGDGQLYSGWDVVLDDALNVYVCNQVRDEGGYVVHDGIEVFTSQGEFLRELGPEDYLAHPDARVRKAYGLDIDNQQRIYVADYAANTVRVFDRDGRQLAELFGRSGIAAGEFDGLNDVAVDDQRGYLYAVDNVNAHVQQFFLSVSDDGTLAVVHRSTFGTYGHAAGQFAYPQYVAVNDRNGLVYVGDMANRRIQVFDPEGIYVGAFAPPGVVDWQVMGLAVADDDAVYAADAFNNAVWVFEADGSRRRRLGGGS